MDLSVRGNRLNADIQAVIAADYIRNLRTEVYKGQNYRLKQRLSVSAAVGVRAAVGVGCRCQSINVQVDKH